MRYADATAHNELFEPGEVSQRSTASPKLTPRPPGLLLTGLVTLFLTSLVVSAVCEIFYWTTRAELARKQGMPVSDILLTTRSKEQEYLNRYQWLKKADGKLRIPVDRARAQVIADYSRTKREVSSGSTRTELSLSSARVGGR